MMMIKRFVYSIVISFSVLSVAAAQDLDQILDAHFKAIGQEKVLKVETMEASGKMIIEMMGAEGGIKIYNKKPNKMRVEVDIMGSSVVQASDGTTAWSINPMTGSSGALKVTGAEAEGMMETADMEGILWNYQEKGHQLELQGTEEVDGSKAYVLKLTKKNGNVDHYYIDAQDYVIVKTKTKTMANGMEMEVETFLSDYREVNGYLSPYSIQQKIGGQAYSTIKLEKVTYDVPIDDAVFAMPDGEGETSIF